LNNTKWNEIFKAFYENECDKGNGLPSITVPWMTKDKQSGYETAWDETWSHFGCEPINYQEIEWLKIMLTNENRAVVLSILRRIHVPGELIDDHVIIYGYKQSDWL
jgi:hypothetical protein